MNAAGEWAAEPAINWLIDRLDRSYARMRKSARETIEERALKADAKIKEALSASQATRPIIEGFVYESIDFTHERTQNVASGLAGYLRGGQLIANYLFWFLCIRSFLYVFGRVAFVKGTRARIDFSSRKSRRKKFNRPADIIHHGREYILKDRESETWFFSRKLEPHGAPPAYSIPQAGKATFGRIRHGVWSMNRIKIRKGRGQVHFTSVGAAEYVEWNLRKGERVMFDYESFVGMSNSITLEGHLSLRISTMILGRIIFPVAVGPGTIVLQTKGLARVGNDPQTRMAMPPSRLAAWEQNTKFSVESNVGFVDVYMSGAYVKVDGDGEVILDADKSEAAKTGVSRFIRYFLLPF